MHIVFGGAFNGKRQYVKDRLNGHEVYWSEGELPDSTASEATIVIAGLENWIKQQLGKGLTEGQMMEQIRRIMDSEQSRQIWILTDLNRGIVPTERIEREMRDLVGRLYQHLFAEAEKITRIWYGIPEKIK